MSSLSRTIRRNAVHEVKRKLTMQRLARIAKERAENLAKYPPVARIKDVKHGKRLRYVPPMEAIAKPVKNIKKRSGSVMNGIRKYFSFLNLFNGKYGYDSRVK